LAHPVYFYSVSSFLFCLRPGRGPAGLRQMFVGNLVCDLVSDKFDVMEFRLPKKSPRPGSRHEPKKVRGLVRDLVCDQVSDKIDLMEFRF